MRFNFTEICNALTHYKAPGLYITAYTTIHDNALSQKPSKETNKEKIN